MDTLLAKLWSIVRRQLRQLTYLRLAFVFILIGLVVVATRYSWYLPVAGNVERVLFDIRTVTTAPQVEQDDRIIMITYTDETLFKTGIRSPVDRNMLRKALANIDQMGAQSIGIDIAFDSPRPEDGDLKAQFEAMETPTWLAYIEHSEDNNSVIRFEQHEFLVNFQNDISNPKVQPANVRLDQDPDGGMRYWPTLSIEGPPPFVEAIARGRDYDAARVTEPYRGSIRFRLPLLSSEGASEPVFAKIPIDVFAAEMDDLARLALGTVIEGRYVFIGGDIVDYDRFDTPLSSVIGAQISHHEPMIGMEVHAHMLAQKLDEAWMVQIPAWILWGLAIFAIVSGSLAGIVQLRPRWLIPTGLVQTAIFGGLPFYLHAQGYDTRSLPAFGWIVGWVISYAVVVNAARIVGARQRTFAQSALGKYLPHDVASLIINDPDRLSLYGEKRHIFPIFTDMESFTTLSSGLTPEEIANILNPYFDKMSDVILHYGGTVDKFIGDGIMAFWGAPISYEDDGKRVADAAMALHQAGEDFRFSLADTVPNIGMTRVGLHAGEAVVGNFGGQDRIQYTALGDSINTAARLEAANKELKTRVLVSHEAMVHSDRTDFVAMGWINVRGRAKPIEVYEPRPNLDPAIRDQVNEMVAAYYAKEWKDYQALAKQVAAIDDAAFQALIERLEAQRKTAEEK